MTVVGRLHEKIKRKIESMKAAVLHRYDPELRNNELVTYQEIPDPDPPTGEEVLIHIRAAGVCRTDLHMISGRDLGIPVASLPHVLGHENAGEVEAIGEDVQGFEIGDTRTHDNVPKRTRVHRNGRSYTGVVRSSQHR